MGLLNPFAVPQMWFDPFTPAEEKMVATGLLALGPLIGIMAGNLASGAGASGYSVAFETIIPKLGAGTRAAHFKAANEVLQAELKTSTQFAALIEKLGIRVPASGTGQALGRSPSGWTWHHVPDRPGVMQLVPTAQHQASLWQRLFHPGGEGGFKLWGADY